MGTNAGGKACVLSRIERHAASLARKFRSAALQSQAVNCAILRKSLTHPSAAGNGLFVQLIIFTQEAAHGSARFIAPQSSTLPGMAG
jgi:hypothetical protein